MWLHPSSTMWWRRGGETKLAPLAAPFAWHPLAFPFAGGLANPKPAGKSAQATSMLGALAEAAAPAHAGQARSSAPERRGGAEPGWASPAGLGAAAAAAGATAECRWDPLAACRAGGGPPNDATDRAPATLGPAAPADCSFAASPPAARCATCATHEAIRLEKIHELAQEHARRLQQLDHVVAQLERLQLQVAALCASQEAAPPRGPPHADQAPPRAVPKLPELPEPPDQAAARTPPLPLPLPLPVPPRSAGCLSAPLRPGSEGPRPLMEAVATAPRSPEAASPELRWRPGRLPPSSPAPIQVNETLEYFSTPIL
jgi:hypothetical protein